MVEKINYTIKKNKRTRKVRISINHAGAVVVTMPSRFGDHVAEKFIQAKSDWVIAAQEKMREKYKDTVFMVQNKHDFKENKDEALALIEERVDYFNDFYKFTVNNIKVKNHYSRWGSCSGKGNLNFNYTLLKLPEELVDYVVVHELCHLQEMNHGKNFWKLVEQQIPDYKARRKQLKSKYVAR